MLLLSLLLAAQRADRLPPANALPPPDSETAAVLAPVNAMFAALTASDGAAMLAQVWADGNATVAIEREDGTRAVRTMRWADFAAGLKPGPQRVEERMINPAVDIDGDIAMIWAPYQYLVDGRVQHCGVNHFSLVREGTAWKVLNVTWTQRTAGCTAA